MIYVRVNGGIGNQLFRYATARALAARNDAGLVIDLSWYRVEQTPPRMFFLDKLNISGRSANAREILGLNQLRKQPGRLGQALRLLPPLLKDVQYINEKQIFFKPEIYSLSGNIYLDSDCQTEKYFKGIKSILQKELSLKTSPSNFFLVTKKKIDSRESISLHIRRGDYVTNPKVSGSTGLVPISYYLKATEYIAQRRPNPVFFIFSDDLPWAQKNIKLSYPVEFIEHPEKNRDYEEVLLMAACKHNILANSTFGWWGGWLNKNPQKIICAPQRWFLNPNIDTRDIVPDSWIRL